jgi:catechol 2,3-dioxygenase-like lactoylglutathione lyase family enzyme
MITIQDIAYIRVSVHDLEKQERFLLDFGMKRAARTDRALYMRGAGTQPVLHISELKTDKYRPAIGLVATSLADLETTARTFGVTVEKNLEPGGGKIVRVTDPAGFQVEVVHRPPADALPLRVITQDNVGPDRKAFGRLNAYRRFERGPSQVLRLGHVGMVVPNCDEAFEWYSRHFNFKPSDSFYAGDDAATNVAMFARCGLGQRFTDHHTLALFDRRAFPDLPDPGFDHSAYEVLDWDDVMVGHDHLLKGGYVHSFGVGRHVAGGMVFDYWRDSAGNKIEHWSDGDNVNDDYPKSHQPIGSIPFNSWGPEPAPNFFTQPSI